MKYFNAYYRVNSPTNMMYKSKVRIIGLLNKKYWFFGEQLYSIHCIYENKEWFAYESELEEVADRFTLAQSEIRA